MALKYTKKQVQKIVAALEADYDDAESAALAVLGAAEEVFEERATWTVVGQLSATRERPIVPPEDPEAIRICLGFFSTEGDARKAAESLWHQTASGDTFRTWYLPVHHGTPADFHGKRRQRYRDLEEKQRERRKQALQLDIQEWQKNRRARILDSV